MKTKPPPRRFPHQGKAFTLVELLVVIAVIAVLLVLVLNVAGQISQKAASVKCVNHLRQLASAHLSYCAEHNGYPPPNNFHAGDPGSEGHNDWGIRLLRQYYLSGPPYIYTEDGIWIDDPIESCPVMKGEKRPLDYSICSLPTTNYLTFYQQPSRRPLIWDSWNPQGSWSPSKPVAIRHNHAMNCAFLDGHVETIQGTDKRLYNQWWYYTINHNNPDDSKLGTGTAMGTLKPPNS